jgi:hypothetical protein
VAHPFVEYKIEPVPDSSSISNLAPPTISPFSNPATDPARPPFQVPTFSQRPPTSICGCRRWPTAPEQQAILSNQLPDLQDVYVWDVQFLDPSPNAFLAAHPLPSATAALAHPSGIRDLGHPIVVAYGALARHQLGARPTTTLPPLLASFHISALS